METKQFIKNCLNAYGKRIPSGQNDMEVIAKAIDIRKVKGFSWKNMARAWGICEATIAGSKETGSLRVLWYRSFKQYAMSVMGDELNLDKANALLSQGLAELVRSGEYLYIDFGVEDFAYSKNFSESIIEKLNCVFFCEKASEFPKFMRTCEILGIKVIIQGSGRPNFSSTEYIFTHYFKHCVDAEHPIRILTLTDFDYDGIIPIANGFVKQMRHYTPYVKTGRVGLNHDQIPAKRANKEDALYEVRQDTKNAPKDEWMDENLFKDKNGRFLGAEVECHPFSYYYTLVWDALKQTGITYEDYIRARYEIIQPDANHVARVVSIELLEDDLEDIDDEIDRLRSIRENMITEKRDEIISTVGEIAGSDDFIYHQKYKPEKSIYDALKKQRTWSGGLKTNVQRDELKRRSLKALED